MTLEKTETSGERTIEVRQYFGDKKKIVLSETASAQLLTLQTIFKQASFGDEKATINLVIDNHEDGYVYVSVSPTSVAMSKKTGHSKGALEGQRDFPANTALSNLVVLSELFNEAIGDLYHKVMDQDSVFLFDNYEQEEPAAMFVVKDGKIQLGLD